MDPAPSHHVNPIAWYLLTTDGSLSVRVLSGLTVGVDATGSLVFNGIDDERLITFDLDEQGLKFEVIGKSHKVYLNQLPVEGKLRLTLNCHLLLDNNELQFDCRSMDANVPAPEIQDSIKIAMPGFNELGLTHSLAMEESSAAERDPVSEPIQIAESELGTPKDEVEVQEEKNLTSAPAEEAREETKKEAQEETEVIVLNALPEVIVAEAPIRAKGYKRKQAVSPKRLIAVLFLMVGATLAWFLYQQDSAMGIKSFVELVAAPILTPQTSDSEVSDSEAAMDAVGTPSLIEQQVGSEVSTRASRAELVAREMRLANWLEEGDLLLSQGFWTRGRDTAAARYLQVLEVDADNQRAVEGMQVIYAGIMRMSDPVAQSRSLSAIDTLVADLPALQNLKAKIEQVRQPPEVFSLSSSLAEVSVLMGAGYISEPVGANAVSVLQEILKQQPGNPNALSLLEQCAERLVSTAEEAELAGMRYEARNLIEEVLAFLPQHQPANTLWQKWQGDN